VGKVLEVISYCTVYGLFTVNRGSLGEGPGGFKLLCTEVVHSK